MIGGYRVVVEMSSIGFGFGGALRKKNSLLHP